MQRLELSCNVHNAEISFAMAPTGLWQTVRRGYGVQCRRQQILIVARHDRTARAMSQTYIYIQRLREVSAYAFDLPRRRSVPQPREGFRRCIVYYSLLLVSGRGVVSSD